MDMDFDLINDLELINNNKEIEDIKKEVIIEKKIGHYEKDPLRVFFTKFGDPINVLEELKDTCKVCDARISLSDELRQVRYINKNRIMFN